MHGKNRLPVKLKDLQADQERIYKTAWIKCLSLLPSLSSLVRHVVSLSSITTLTNTSGAEPLSPHSTLWLPDHNSDTGQKNTQTAFWEGKGHFPRWRKQGKVISGRQNTQKYKTFFWVSAPNPTTFIHDTRKFTALSYRTAEDLLEVKVL